MTDQIKIKNEFLTSKVSYLESKYISSVLDAEKSKLDLSLLQQKDKLLSCLLPSDFGESVGLLLEFVLLFTRLKSKCELLSNAVELHQNLKYQRNVGKMDDETVLITFDSQFVSIK